MSSPEDPQCIPEIAPPSQVSHESQSEQQNKPATKVPVIDVDSISISRNAMKVSCEDLDRVKNLIEHCLQLYMNKEEVVKILSSQAKIEPAFTCVVWERLEEENADFFKAYYIRLKLKKQINMFNNLLQRQQFLMKYPKVPQVSLAPVTYLLQKPPIPATGHLHPDSMGCGPSSRHSVNGVAARGNFHPIMLNSGNAGMMNNVAADVAPVTHPCNAMSSLSGMAGGPAPVAPSGHFPFTASEMSNMDIDTSALGTFTPDMANTGGLHQGTDGGAGTSSNFHGSLDQIPWILSNSDFDLSHFTSTGDFAMGGSNKSLLLPSDLDFSLNPQEHDKIDDFIVETPELSSFPADIPGPSSQPTQLNTTQQSRCLKLVGLKSSQPDDKKSKRN
ncbi:uncharacterized protein LOC143889323 isoform X2 [Tasmannia lanceolata]|uniref:uncharacterized protein LOC143889323 isoform X2 n=1 Tax=Tasmannia lanceolata TaxID=3420 RepID=UPI0040643CA4